MLRILTYHRVAEPSAAPWLDPGQISATPDDFRLQVEHLASNYRPVDLRHVLDAFRGRRSLPRRAVLVTFDDAYRDFADTAWPILREHGVPATVFVPTAFAGRAGGEFWWDRIHRALCDPDATGEADERGADRASDGPAAPPPPAPGLQELKALVKRLSPEEADELVDRICAGSSGGLPPPAAPAVVGWDELRALRGEGVDVGSHTRTHPALVNADDERIREELAGSLADLSAHVGDVAAVICYPYGLFDDRVVRAAREVGFELGFTALDGLSRPRVTDPLRLRRTNVTRRTSPFVFRIRMQPWFAAVDRWRHRRHRRRLGALRAEEEGRRSE